MYTTKAERIVFFHLPVLYSSYYRRNTRCVLPWLKLLLTIARIQTKNMTGGDCTTIPSTVVQV